MCVPLISSSSRFIIYPFFPICSETTFCIRNVLKGMTSSSFDEPSFLDHRAHSKLSQPIAHHPWNYEHTIPFASFNPIDEISKFHVNPVNWLSLQQVYPILSAHGGPTCIYPAQSYFALGTSRGSILIFNYKQFLQTTLIAPDIDIRSEVTQICSSFDGTHIAASYKSGDVVIWDLNSNVVDSDHPDQSQKISFLLHITKHSGQDIIGLGFVGRRHTAIVVGDRSGKVLFHNGSRNHLWQMSYNTKSIMTLSSSDSKLLETAPFPSLSDSLLSDMHLIAVLSSRSFGLISTNGKLVTQYLEKVAEYKGDEGHISWEHQGNKVAYSLDDSLTVLQLSRSCEDGSLIVIKKLQWTSQENIKGIQWVLNDLVGILTVSNEYLVVSPFREFDLTIKIDLLPFDPLPPTNKHFTCINKQLFLLTSYSLKVGKLLSWSDIILHYVQRGEYIAALKTVGFFLTSGNASAPLLGLEPKTSDRKKQLEKPFKNLSLASVRYLLQTDSTNPKSEEQFSALFTLIIDVDTVMFTDANERMQLAEETLELLDHEQKKFFFDAISNQILEGVIKSLPPIVLTQLLTYYADLRDRTIIERLILELEPQNLSIDLAVRLTQIFEMNEVLIYVWNKTLDDYLTPLVDLIYKITNQDSKCLLFKEASNTCGDLIYDYISFIMTGRQYPKNEPLETASHGDQVKLKLNSILFSGALVEWPPRSSHKLPTCDIKSEEPAFPYMKVLLTYNPRHCLSMLNEILEDPFLDDENVFMDEITSIESTYIESTYAMRISRQFIIDVLIDILRASDDSLLRVLISIFITRNIPKYPQYIKLSNQTVDSLISIICSCPDVSLGSESQRSLESLFATYKPSITKHLMTSLKEKNFDRALFVIYKHSGQLSKMLQLRICSPQLHFYPLSLLEVLELCLKYSSNNVLEKTLITEVIRENFERIASQNTALVVDLFERFDADLHAEVLKLRDETTQRAYLRQLFSLDCSYRSSNKDMKYLYVDLSCKSEETIELNHWLQHLDLNTIDVEHMINILRKYGNINGLIITMTRLHDFSSAMDEIIHCLNGCFRQTPQSSVNDKVEEYVELAIGVCEAATGERVDCWVKLLVCLIVNYGGESKSDQKARNLALQTVFGKLASLRPLTADKEERQQLWSILTTALENQELILMKVKDMKPVLNDVFITYLLDEHIQKAILKLINDSSLDIITDYREELECGWSIRKCECEICGKRTWGVGLDSNVYSLWKEVRTNKECHEPDLSTRGYALVVFKCHHGFHIKCVENLGQKKGTLFVSHVYK